MNFLLRWNRQPTWTKQHSQDSWMIEKGCCFLYWWMTLRAISRKEMVRRFWVLLLCSFWRCSRSFRCTLWCFRWGRIISYATLRPIFALSSSRVGSFSTRIRTTSYPSWLLALVEMQTISLVLTSSASSSQVELAFSFSSFSVATSDHFLLRLLLYRSWPWTIRSFFLLLFASFTLSQLWNLQCRFDSSMLESKQVKPFRNS